VALEAMVLRECVAPEWGVPEWASPGCVGREWAVPEWASLECVAPEWAVPEWASLGCVDQEGPTPMTTMTMTTVPQSVARAGVVPEEAARVDKLTSPPQQLSSHQC
jgi:hypothetical protein